MRFATARHRPDSRAEFSVRFRAALANPKFRAEGFLHRAAGRDRLARLHRPPQCPFTRNAGPAYADPNYELSIEWIASIQWIAEARRRWSDLTSPSRVLVICGSARKHGTCRALSAGLDWMGFIDADAQARLDRYIGYYEPCATSHDALDRDMPVQAETRNVARALATTVVELRAGRLQAVQPKLPRARPR